MSSNTEFSLKDLESVAGLDDLEGVKGVSDFDSAKYLDTKESIAAYLSFAAQSGDAEHLKAAMKTAARAEKMAKIAADAGVTREGAYKALRPGTKTQLQTALAILDALGMAIQIIPKDSLARDNSHVQAA